MRKYFLFLFIPFIFAFCQQKDYKAQSEKIFEQIRNHEFSKVTAEFDSSMLAHIDTSRLRMVWDKLLPLTGPFVKVLDISTETNDSSDIVIQHLQFERRKIDFKLVFGTNEKIKGITFLPGEKREKYNSIVCNNIVYER